ncbi:MAG: cation:proton antiporter [Actinomycetota bacterium]|nr:cation:proton antiporter [Actinomycetota bacterium]
MKVIPPLSGHELLLVVFQFALLLLVARTLGEVVRRFGLPSVVGELLAGFVLGHTLFGNLFPRAFEAVFPQTTQQFHLIEVIMWVGVIMLLVLTGLETDTELIVRKGKGAAAISIGGIVIPFLTGAALGFVLPQEFLARPDQRFVFALFIGTAMSISAIPVIAKILMEMNVIRRDLGQITLAAGMIDDTAGWILLSVVAGLASSGTVSFGSAGMAILSVLIIFVLAFTLGRRFVRWAMRMLDVHLGGDMVMITGLMVIALLFGSLTHLLHLEAVLGAFIAGILVGEVKRFDHRLQHIFEQLTLGVFAPVFFAMSGIRVNLAELARPTTALVAAAVLAVAILGKFVGVYAGAKVSRMGHWEALSLGAAMNARGAIEIIVATIGLSLGVLTLPMYSIILMISIVTSIMAPPLLRWTLRRAEFSEEEQERLEAEERREESFVPNLKRVLLPSTGGAKSQIAAQVLGLLIEGEEVEVTRMIVTNAELEGSDERFERIDERFNDVRKVERECDDGIASVVLDEAGQGYDLLVLAAAEEGAKGSGPLFRDLVDEIIQDSPCPLLLIAVRPDVEGGDADLDLRHILLPVHGTQDDRRAAEVAFWLARDRDVVVDVLHIVSSRHHETLTKTEKESASEAVEMGEDLVNEIADLGHAMGATVHTRVLVADQRDNAIVDYGRDRADLIVLLSDHRPVSQRAFFGHETDHILREASCPVVVISGR